MITGNLKDAERYMLMSDKIAKAFRAAAEFCADTPKSGTYEIDGRSIYASVQQYDTAPAESLKWEAHHQYIDLQVVVNGTEYIEYAHIDNLTPVTPYDEKGDYLLLEGSGSKVKLSSGDFMLLFPEDAHKPRCAYEKSEAVSKVVIKIKL
jgi:biofilm protein TabA